MVTIWDDQTGKYVSGYVVNETETTFTLIDDLGEEIGKFDISLIKQLYEH